MCDFTITVDTEEEWDWSSGYPTSKPSVRNIEALPTFQDVCDRYAAKTTYFVNHAVLDDPSASSIIAELANHPNVEIGFHIHPWNTPPLQGVGDVPERESFLHNLPRELAIAKLDTVLDAFRKHGLAPTSYRGGRYSTSDWIQDHLYSNGCIADASVLPFTTWPDDGAPDFRDRDLTPRRRSMGQDLPGLWEIPLTLAFTRKPWPFWQKFYQTAERPPFRQLHCAGIAERLFVKRVWLNLEHPLGESIAHLLPVIRKEQLPCINFTLHSSSLTPGMNSYSPTQRELDRLYHRLETTLDQLGRWSEFRSATVSQVAHNLESQFNANSRN